MRHGAHPPSLSLQATEGLKTHFMHEHIHTSIYVCLPFPEEFQRLPESSIAALACPRRSDHLLPRLGRSSCKRRPGRLLMVQVRTVRVDGRQRVRRLDCSSA